MLDQEWIHRVSQIRKLLYLCIFPFPLTIIYYISILQVSIVI